MPPKGKYTDPELRDQVKQDVQDGDKGGAPGQWSARKAQFMASEYKKRGGGYTTDKDSGQDDSQKNLSKWTDEEWQTKEGGGHAKKDDGTQKRYLPKKAWEEMSEGEKEETDQEKQEESAEGKQFVGNTDKAKKARKKAGGEEDDDVEEEEEEEGDVAADDDDDVAVEDDEDGDDDEEYGEEEDEDDDEDNEQENQDEDAEPGQKRSKAPSSSSKKLKSNSGSAKSKSKGNAKSNGTVGSKHQPADAPAPQASADRLPKKGQSVTWKALPGWVEGEVLEIVHESKKVEGKQVKASKNDPRIVMRSKNGKVAVHKPEAVYFG